MKQKEHLCKTIVLALSCLLITTAGCAPQAQVGMLERQVSGLLRENQTLNNEIASLKASIQRLEGINYDGGALAQIRKRQAVLDNRLTALQSDILRLSGQIDMIQHEGGVAVPLLTNQTIASNDANSTKPKSGQQQNKESAGKAHTDSNNPPEKVEEQHVRRPLSGENIYESALDLLKQGNPMEAKALFRDFISKNPKSQRVPNAYYWSGDCEYKMNRYEEAILEYQKVISRYPASNKVPDALLKQGLAFLKLGDRESAKIVLNKLVKKYPSSPQATTAKKQLRRIR